jgi:hypothetical protein
MGFAARTVVLVSLGLLGACSTSAPSGRDAAAAEDRGSVHTPQSGCREGFVACAMGQSEMCADLSNDGAHCGACPQQCGAGSCVNGACTTDTSCTGARCAGACIGDRASNADHCGSCLNRCSDREICVQGACISGGGDGTSCQAPFTWEASGAERAGFRLGLAEPFAFSCAGSLPARTFRFVATKDEVDVTVEKGSGAALEVFTGASCDAAARVGCSAAPEPSVHLVGAKGKTFFARVGAPVGTPLTLRVDH